MLALICVPWAANAQEPALETLTLPLYSDYYSEESWDTSPNVPFCGAVATNGPACQLKFGESDVLAMAGGSIRKIVFIALKILSILMRL